MSRILIIDDDTFICQAIQKYLSNHGMDAEVAYTGVGGLKLLAENTFDLVLCDFRLPDRDGLDMLKEIKRMSPDTPVVIITAYADVRMAVKLMKQGAHDYITKPLQQEEILNLAKKISKKGNHAKTKQAQNPDFITGESKVFKQSVGFAQKVAPTDMSVLIQGETGTGKEYIARFIHQNSKRKSKPFVAVDCGAIPKELAGSELFGHIKGSFTGAVSDKTGVFQQADGGTLFLDEIGNLGYGVQVQLLRALQERVVTRLGENKPVKVDVRVIAATNEMLNTHPDENNFRDDLLHRINEFKIVLPPLRERKEDIVAFAEHFRKMANRELGVSNNSFSEEVIEIFKRYPWHGNIRELKNVVKRAVLLTGENVINPDVLPDEIINPGNFTSFENEGSKGVADSLKSASADVEKHIIINAIEQAGYNKSEAARALKIDRKTLYNKIRQYGIDI